MAKKTEMMICPIHTCKTMFAPHKRDVACDMEPKCIPYDKPQVVWVVQIKKHGQNKWKTISGDDTRSLARSVKYELQDDFQNFAYRIRRAVIQEGK